MVQTINERLYGGVQLGKIDYKSALINRAADRNLHAIVMSVEPMALVTNGYERQAMRCLKSVVRCYSRAKMSCCLRISRRPKAHCRHGKQSTAGYSFAKG